MKLYPRIGLEIHAELTTKTKCFCDCKNNPDEIKPNTNICPICMGYPGTLPVLNKQAVKNVISLGVAINGKIADFTEFDRKNYFYPDIPKGYQISQYKHPLVSGGSISGINVTRVHLEEDTARSQHGLDQNTNTMVDFNRSGVPLMELVTEPEIKDGKGASVFAKDLQLLIQNLGIGHANLEKGEMRVEVNISVSEEEEGYGTKVEIKNLNSFRSVEKAIDYEIKRQGELIEKGESIVQETRGWDEKKEITFSQRAKENSHDYRYFPEPDIPKIKISEIEEFSLENIKSSLPELPSDKRERYSSYNLKSADVEVLVRDNQLSKYMDAFIKEAGGESEAISLGVNYLMTDVLPLIQDDNAWGEKLTPRAFLETMKMVIKGDLSSRGAKNLLPILIQEGGEAGVIAERENLLQKSDDSFIENLGKKIINDFPEVVAEYKNGKLTSMQFLIGQAMKESKGSGNPSKFKEFFEKNI